MTKIVEMNCETGVETVRDMTDEEETAHATMLTAHNEQVAAEQAEADAKAAAKASGDAKLKELGLTDEEIAAR